MPAKTLSRDLTEGNIASQLLCFVGPLFVSNVLQTVYNVVDMAVVGHYVGNVGLSAVSVCGDLMNILTFTAMGFANAGQVLISQYVGARQPDKIKQLIGNLFTLLLAAAIGFTVIAICFGDAILGFANVPHVALPEAKAYFVICSAGLVFTYGYNAVGAILRGMGDSKHPFIFIAFASVLNIVLDFCFVAGLGLGSAGAALATVISQAVSFTVSIVFLFKNREAFGFDFKLRSFVLCREAVISLVNLGVPIALQYGLIQCGKIMVTRWINGYGVNVSAITGVGSKLNSIGLTFASAVGTSAAAMIGQCIGAGKHERVLKTICVSGTLSVGIGTALAGIVAAFPETVFGIFTSDTDVLAMSQSFMPVAVVLIYSSAFRAPMNGLINGSGHSQLNLLLAILDGVVGHIGLAALFGFVLDYGLPGLWYGNAAAGFIPFFVGIVFYLSGKWKTTTK